MSDYEDIQAEAREQAAAARIRRINKARAWRATHGPPGDPPELTREK